MGFRVTEAAVELKHLRPARREHESGIEQTAIGSFILPQGVDDGDENVALDQVQGLVVEERRRAVGAHAAGVGALVVIEQSLVIL
jgi:hypothetical protein